MLYQQVFYFCGRVGGGGVEIWRLKLTSAKVEVEVEAELGKKCPQVPEEDCKMSQGV